MIRKGSPLIRLSGVVVLAVTALAGCEQPVEVADVVRPARVIRIAEPGALSGRALPGRAQAVEEVNLSFDVSGTVATRPASVGDIVEKGQVLARLDDRDYRNERDAAKAARDRARANFERIQIAARSGAVSKQDVDDARAQLEVRDAELNIRQKAVEDSVITAPRDGTISATYAEVFQSVRAKEPMLRLLDTSGIEMVVQVPESLISLATEVEEVWVEFDAFPGRKVPAVITEISNEASQTTRTFPVTLLMEQPEDIEILPGMAGSARGNVKQALLASTSGYQVPMSAVFASNEMAEEGKSFVWLVDEASNSVARREVQTGSLTRHGIMLLSGVESGDLVVISGANSLDEGEEVRPVLLGESG